MLGAILGLVATLQAKAQKARQTKAFVSFSTTSTSYVSALNITGKGRIVGMMVNNGYNTGQLEIIVDGTTFQTSNNLNYGGVSVNDSGIVLSVYNTNSSANPTAEFSFISSCQVNVLTTNASYATSIGILYEMEV